MNERSIAKLAAVFAGLTVATLLAALLSRPPKPSTLAPEGLPEKASRIQLEGPNGKLTLKRDGKGWTASAPKGYPADEKFVGEVLAKLSRATVSEPLTEDPGRYGVFGIAAASATRVRVYEGSGESPVLDLCVGTDGPDYPSAFVRIGQASAVVQANGIAAMDLAKAPGEWLRRDVVAVNPDALTRVAVKGPKGSWELATTPKGWALAGSPLPPEKVAGLVKPARDAAAKLEADTVIDAADAPGDAETGFSKPDLAVELSTGTGRFGFLVGGKKDSLGRRYVRKHGEPRALFLVADWRLEPLRRSAADFKKK